MLLIIDFELVFKRFVPLNMFQTSGHYSKTSLATIDSNRKAIHSSWKNCKMFTKFYSASLTFCSVSYKVPKP